MAECNVTVDWALISKEPGPGSHYGVVASSVDTDFGRYVGHYMSGAPSPPCDPARQAHPMGYI
jgi:hypothetical protein